MSTPAHASPAPLAIVVVLKALASQLIVWHHLVFYGPMSDVVYPHAIGLFDWLYDQARIAVQVFLVLGGFLAARSLFPRNTPPASTPAPLLRQLLWRRYLRLVRPYLAALLVALLAAAFARALAPNPSLPSVPTLAQLAAHGLLLQDVLGLEALSAGVWYVAMDFQLYALLALLLALVRRYAPDHARTGPALAVAACTVLVALSLLWVNRHSALDAWAPYFFGAYGLGVLAQRITLRQQRLGALALLVLLVTAALVLEWRSRILVAGCTAVLLVVCADWHWKPNAAWAFLERISYALFLIHYPVFLLVSSVVHACWPDNVALNAVGMAATWVVSIGAATLLNRWVENPHQSRSQRAGN